MFGPCPRRTSPKPRIVDREAGPWFDEIENGVALAMAASSRRHSRKRFFILFAQLQALR
jgi:hypothetical protein